MQQNQRALLFIPCVLLLVKTWHPLLPTMQLDLRFYEDLKAYLKPNSEDYLQPMITFLSWITTIRDS